MSLHIIIDGYNLIRQSSQWRLPDMQNIQLGQEALLEAMAEYKREKSHRITVVFDAAEVPSFIRKNDAVQKERSRTPSSKAPTPESFQNSEVIIRTREQI